MPFYFVVTTLLFLVGELRDPNVTPTICFSKFLTQKQLQCDVEMKIQPKMQLQGHVEIKLYPNCNYNDILKWNSNPNGTTSKFWDEILTQNATKDILDKFLTQMSARSKNSLRIAEIVIGYT